MSKQEWFQDDSFWEATYHFLFTDERFDEPDRDAALLSALTGVKSGQVLDLCCGPGRWSLGLARKGFNVTGVDRTAFLLEKAKDRARAAGVSVEWIQEDMRSFARQGHYDLVINMFSSFGYFEDRNDDRIVLEKMFRNLAPGGVLVIDTMSKELIAGKYQPVIAHDMAGGGLLVERPVIVDDWTRVKNEWFIIKEDQVGRFRFHQNIYSGWEMKTLILEAGFSDACLYGALDGRPYGIGAERLVALGFKSSDYR